MVDSAAAQGRSSSRSPQPTTPLSLLADRLDLRDRYLCQYVCISHPHRERAYEDGSSAASR
jgi:hypothetical protein